MLTGVLLVAAAVTGGIDAAPAGAQNPSGVKPTQELTTLLRSHELFSAPDVHRGIGAVLGRRPLTGQPTVLPVIGHATTRRGVHWLRVMLPGRPNGMKGWIAERATVLRTTRWHLVVSTSNRRVVAYSRGRVVRSFGAIVGKPSTPTPEGQFFVEESVVMLPGSAGGPYALALSARSDVLQQFEGGPGQIAIHGIENLGGTIGTAVSHGCIRLDTEAITWLANRIGPGTPVTIAQ